jgi:hypothetical protein
MDRYRDLLGTVTNAPISIDGMVFDQALRRLHQSQATYEAMDQQYPSIGVYLQKIGVTPAAFASLPSLSAFQTDLNAIHTAPNQPADLALTNKSPCPQGGQFIDSLAEVDPSKLPIMDYSMEEHFRTTAMFGSYPLGEEADRQLTGIATTVLSNASLPAFVKDHCKSILKAGDSLLHDKLSNLPGSAAGFDQYDEIEAREEEASRTVKDPLIFWSLWWKNRH